MKKELQDYVWKYCLPKEFKEEVIDRYIYACEHCEESYWYGVKTELEYFFGEHNLTSDAEGEDEVLTINRKRVQEMYKNYCTERDNEEKGSVNRFSLSARIAMLEDLFGSKCLPDEKEDKEPKFRKGNKVVLLSDDGGVHEVEGKTGKHHYALKGVKQDVHEDMLIPYEEPKPSEPKFEVGEKVMYKGVLRVINLVDAATLRYCLLAGNCYAEWVDESNLEPYTEPTTHEFKVGDKVRYKGDNEICTVEGIEKDGIALVESDFLVAPEDLELYEEVKEGVAKMKPIKSKVSVYLATKEEDEEFRMLLHENGFKWNTGESLIGNSIWSFDEESSKIHNIYPDKSITYSGDITLNILPFSKFKKKYFEENVNLSQETANCDKEFDTILKDSFSKERRLNIAAMIAQGIMANSNPQMVEMDVHRVADLAILTADTLIAECKKKGDKQ